MQGAASRLPEPSGAAGPWSFADLDGGRRRPSRAALRAHGGRNRGWPSPGAGQLDRAPGSTSPPQLPGTHGRSETALFPDWTPGGALTPGAGRLGSWLFPPPAGTPAPGAGCGVGTVKFHRRPAQPGRPIEVPRKAPDGRALALGGCGGRRRSDPPGSARPRSRPLLDARFLFPLRVVRPRGIGGVEPRGVHEARSPRPRLPPRPLLQPMLAVPRLPRTAGGLALFPF